MKHHWRAYQLGAVSHHPSYMHAVGSRWIVHGATLSAICLNLKQVAMHECTSGTFHRWNVHIAIDGCIHSCACSTAATLYLRWRSQWVSHATRFNALMQGLTSKLLGFRDLLPGVNISLLVSKWPHLVLDFETNSLKDRLEKMRYVIPT